MARKVSEILRCFKRYSCFWSVFVVFKDLWRLKSSVCICAARAQDPEAVNRSL